MTSPSALAAARAASLVVEVAELEVAVAVEDSTSSLPEEAAEGAEEEEGEEEEGEE